MGMRHILSIIMLSLTMAASIANAAVETTSTSAALVPNAEADKIAARFFETVKGGNVAKAVDDIFADAPLMSGKVAEKQQLVGQTSSAIQIYGPVMSYELVRSEALGGLVLKRYYIVQQKNMLTRWEFDFARLPTGWTTVFFGFNDQVPSWL